MPVSGIRPVRGFRLSCIESTEPLLVAVVIVAQRGPAVVPKRSSLPSRFIECSTGSPVKAAVGALAK
jgi:hypothetical protein